MKSNARYYYAATADIMSPFKTVTSGNEKVIRFASKAERDAWVAAGDGRCNITRADAKYIHGFCYDAANIETGYEIEL